MIIQIQYNVQIPSAADIPRQLHVTLLRNAGTRCESVFSSKGVGEPPLTLAVSVVCAIRQAVASYSGAAMDEEALEVPLTSARIRRLCRDEITASVGHTDTQPRGIFS